MKTKNRSSSIILVCILILGACTSAVGTPETPTPAPTVTGVPPTVTLTRVPTETRIPTQTSTPFVPKATIKIASHSPLTGQYSDMGTDVMRGAELAIKQLADSLIVLGYRIELTPYDDQNDIGIAVANTKQIADDPQVLCLVGPFTSRILNQVKEIHHQAGLAFVSPSTTGAYATASGYLEVNRMVGRHDGQGAAGAQFAREQSFSRVFIISQSGNYTEFSAYHFRNESSRLGIEIVGNMTTDARKDFGRFIDRIITANADLVYFSTLDVEQAGTFFREARAAGYRGAFMSNENIGNPALLEFAGPLLIDGGGMYYTSIAALAGYYPKAAGFLEQFETLYGGMPQMFAAQAYDAAGICLKSIEAASTAKAGELPTRAEVANAIRALQDYPGITGTYNFDRNGDPNPAQYFVFKVDSIDPDDWDQNTLIDTYEVSPPNSN